MSIFLDCFKNNGYDYVRIVSGKRIKKADGKISNKRTTIKNLGPLRKYDDGLGEGLIERLRSQFKAEVLDIGMSYDELRLLRGEKAQTITNIESILKPLNIGYFILENIFNKLGISEVVRRYKSDNSLDYDILGLTRLLVYGRILEPKSKKKTFEEQRRKYLHPVTSSENIYEIYKTLDVLDEKSESIQKRMNTKIQQSSIGRAGEITYYDVTNYYFETMYGDDDIYQHDETGNVMLDSSGKPIVLEQGLRKKGVGKDGKANPLVAMGLFIDNNGIPVSYRLFPGNTQDKTTFKEIIKTSFTGENLGRIIVVADNGTNAQENMYLLVTKSNGYIISKSVKQSWNTKPCVKLNKDLVEDDAEVLFKVREWALDESGYDYTYNKQNEMVFKSKSRKYKRRLEDQDGNSVTIFEKEIIFWSKKHYERELRQNEKFIEYLESCKENPDKLKDKQRKSQEFIKVLQIDKKTGEVLKTKAVVVLLEEKIQKQKELMGFYSIVTSEVDMDDREVINKYRGLSRIEDSFRIIKSDLEGRPIYVWTKEHINAHFLICFIALTIVRLIQYKILKHQGKSTIYIDKWEQGITADNLKEALNSFQANLIGDGCYQLTEIKNDIDTIFAAYGLKLRLTLPNISQINNIKNLIANFQL
ncbi:MAG: IS1634 family transposase [Oscillospiraceae bacterium]|jgi:transposase|nr:IS1634 family transposase [Oscillospiraceae bacterium]